MSPSNSGGFGGNDSGGGGGGIGQPSQHMMNMPENTSSLLNSCISRILGVDTHPIWSESVDPTINLITLLEIITTNGGSSVNVDLDQALANCFDEIGLFLELSARLSVNTTNLN